MLSGKTEIAEHELHYGGHRIVEEGIEVVHEKLAGGRSRKN